MLAREFTLEQRARLTDDEAARRELDRRNLAVLRWTSWLLVAVAAGLFLASTRALDTRTILAGVHLAGSLVAAMLIRRASRPGLGSPDRLRPATAWIAERARAFTIGYLFLQFTLVWVLVFGSDPGGVLPAFLFGWFLVAIRLAPAEAILLYASLAGMTFFEGLFAADPDGVVPALMSLGVALVVNLLATRRARSRFLADWRARRADAIEQIRLREELDFAREVQLSMLPREAPPVSWLELTGLSLPATEVGGDYYDYFPLPDGRFVAVIGDVAGHGLASGMVLSGIRSCLTLLIDELGEPRKVMARLDLMLRRTTAHRMFVTLSMLLIDPARRTARITSAGHPPTFVHRAGSGEVERIETASLPLGTRLSSRFDERIVELGPRDVILIQTDGIYESTNAEGEPYGFDRLARVFGAQADASLAERRDAILRDLATFRGIVPQQDDVTIVLLRVLESGRHADVLEEEMIASVLI
ncbi:MAG TPA: PP2C family protein-serine/threonine phosphatase [Thermoanaerobaculia bacterium]|nr:PP2C family protein-serine/threonine phosphatase [Thermoanaerobaculia bacterium]